VAILAVDPLRPHQFHVRGCGGVSLSFVKPVSPFVYSVTRGMSLTCVGPGCGRGLSTNNITSIPTGSFTGLTALQFL
jgi:hypothetical protein